MEKQNRPRLRPATNIHGERGMRAASARKTPPRNCTRAAVPASVERERSSRGTTNRLVMRPPLVALRKTDLPMSSMAKTRTAMSMPKVVCSVSSTPDGSERQTSLRKVRRVAWFVDAVESVLMVDGWSRSGTGQCHDGGSSSKPSLSPLSGCVKVIRHACRHMGGASTPRVCVTPSAPPGR